MYSVLYDTCIHVSLSILFQRKYRPSEYRKAIVNVHHAPHVCTIDCAVHCSFYCMV